MSDMSNNMSLPLGHVLWPEMDTPGMCTLHEPLPLDDTIPFGMMQKPLPFGSGFIQEQPWMSWMNIHNTKCTPHRVCYAIPKGMMLLSLPPLVTADCSGAMLANL